jgi:glc operon protein GlcG
MLSHDDITLILKAARDEALKNNWPVCISVVDDGGHLLALERLDGCAPIGAYISAEKARTAALGRRESKVYEEMINAGRTAFLSAPAISGMLEGGVPIIAAGHVVGVQWGVSGVKERTGCTGFARRRYSNSRTAFKQHQLGDQSEQNCRHPEPRDSRFTRKSHRGMRDSPNIRCYRASRRSLRGIDGF